MHSGWPLHGSRDPLARSLHDYCYPGTETLINKLDERDPDSLREHEKNAVALRGEELPRGIALDFSKVTARDWTQSCEYAHYDVNVKQLSNSEELTTIFNEIIGPTSKDVKFRSN